MPVTLRTRRFRLTRRKTTRRLQRGGAPAIGDGKCYATKVQLRFGENAVFKYLGKYLRTYAVNPNISGGNSTQHDFEEGVMRSGDGGGRGDPPLSAVVFEVACKEVKARGRNLKALKMVSGAPGGLPTVARNLVGSFLSGTEGTLDAQRNALKQQALIPVANPVAPALRLQAATAAAKAQRAAERAATAAATLETATAAHRQARAYLHEHFPGAERKRSAQRNWNESYAVEQVENAYKARVAAHDAAALAQTTAATAVQAAATAADMAEAAARARAALPSAMGASAAAAAISAAAMGPATAETAARIQEVTAHRTAVETAINQRISAARAQRAAEEARQREFARKHEELMEWRRKESR